MRPPPPPLKPFFKHYGSKYMLSLDLPPPRYPRVVELFAGGAGYSLRHHTHEVVLRELDPDTFAIWQWLRRASERDVLALPEELPVTDIRELGLERGALLLLQRWLTPQGSTTNWWAPPSIVENAAASPTSFWGRPLRQRIAEQLPAIRHWAIEQGQWHEAVDDVPSTWIVDPPYQRNLHTSVYGAGDNQAVDFEHLAEVCRRLPGEVYVHEQEGADWLPFEPWRVAQTGSARNGKRKERLEYIWLGGTARLPPSQTGFGWC